MYILGDIHGEYKYIQKYIIKNNIKNTTILQVGDFGIGFGSKQKYIFSLKKLSDFLNEKNINMYIIRGNHDNPIYFYGDWSFDNLKLVKDNSIIKIDNYNILFLGGGTSIDRLYRINNNLNWWPNEKIDNLSIDDNQNIDIIITHAAPGIALDETKTFTHIKHIFDYDTNLEYDLKKEREHLNEIFYNLKTKGLKYWFFGHYHGCSCVDNTIKIVDDVKFKFCDIYEFYKFN